MSHSIEQLLADEFIKKKCPQIYQNLLQQQKEQKDRQEQEESNASKMKHSPPEVTVIS
ncbi:MAG: hypothetical protein AAGA75_19710 [Cyanobacteria bacterium P01_E01_bin.6]